MKTKTPIAASGNGIDCRGPNEKVDILHLGCETSTVFLSGTWRVSKGLARPKWGNSDLDATWSWPWEERKRYSCRGRGGSSSQIRPENDLNDSLPAPRKVSVNVTGLNRRNGEAGNVGERWGRACVHV